MVWLQPFAIAFLLAALAAHAVAVTSLPVTAVVLLNVVAFFLTTMVCHGELAKDRPGTKHLTEFYLWMSVGGVAGGIFNALIAPLIFTGTWEFPLAIFAACLMRPLLKESGWVDSWFATTFSKPAPGTHVQQKAGPGRHVRHHGHAAETPQLHRTLDVALPFGILILTAILAMGLRGPLTEVFGGYVAATFWSILIPGLISCFFLSRPLRFGLAIGAILLIEGLATSRGESVWYADRSYFGILRVLEATNELGTYTSLRHGTTLHGQNFRRPESKKDWGNPEKDWSRLANTYYHRRGPAGVVMEKFNWFHGPENTYWSDSRMPASIVALGGDPMSQLVNLWSEPPYAVIGLGTGTMASYARLGQHCHYYEIDNHIVRLSNDVKYKDGRPCFTYLQDAKERGAPVWIYMGDARLKMDEPYEEGSHPENSIQPGGGPEKFYHMMVVDAFSSDAIPVHLLTKEAVEMYFKHLTEKGILCVHTSNRHIDLVPVVADIARSLKNEDGTSYGYLRGHDNVKDSKDGHSSSEWVMVARRPEYLQHLRAPEGYNEDRLGQYWTTPTTMGGNPWTDDFSNVLSRIRELSGSHR
jgi:hypothetical protein